MGVYEMSSSVSSLVKVNISLPTELKEEIKKISKEHKTNISNFIREAAKERVKKIKREKLVTELIEQCKETSKLNIEICNDFKYVDGEYI